MPCPSVGRSVGTSVGNAFVKIDENGLLVFSKSAGRGGKRDDEERGTGFEVRRRVFGWFSGLHATFGLGPTTVYWF